MPIVSKVDVASVLDYMHPFSVQILGTILSGGKAKRSVLVHQDTHKTISHLSMIKKKY